MAHPVVRSATTADIAVLLDIWAEAGLRFHSQTARNELRVLIEAGSELVLVATKDGTQVSTVVGTWDGRRGWLQRLATRPGWQGQGCAGALVTELERRLRSLGCTKVNLLIEPDNSEVAGFYARHGFSIDNLVFMEKSL